MIRYRHGQSSVGVDERRVGIGGTRSDQSERFFQRGSVINEVEGDRGGLNRRRDPSHWFPRHTRGQRQRRNR